MILWLNFAGFDRPSGSFTVWYRGRRLADRVWLPYTGSMDLPAVIKTGVAMERGDGDTDPRDKRRLTNQDREIDTGV